MAPCRPLRNFRVACDVFLVILVVVVFSSVVLLVKPTVRGFYCNDQSISYPNRPSTVTGLHLLLFTLLLAPGTIILLEFCTTSSHIRSVRQSPAARLAVSSNGEDGGWTNGSPLGRSFTAKLCRRACWSASTIYGIFLFGLAVTLGITEVGKLTIGRLRPHFFDVCRPDFSTIDCTQGYIMDYNCTSSVNPRILWEARKSFPSGHSSMAVFTAVFLVFYYRQRLTTRCSLLLKMVIEAVLCSLAMYTCYSRVDDNKHHWSDVLAGAIIGLAVGVWIILFMRQNIEWQPRLPSTSGDYVHQSINASSSYTQPCAVYTDCEA